MLKALPRLTLYALTGKTVALQTAYGVRVGTLRHVTANQYSVNDVQFCREAVRKLEHGNLLPKVVLG